MQNALKVSGSQFLAHLLSNNRGVFDTLKGVLMSYNDVGGNFAEYSVVSKIHGAHGEAGIAEEDDEYFIGLRLFCRGEVVSVTVSLDRDAHAVSPISRDTFSLAGDLAPILVRFEEKALGYGIPGENIAVGKEHLARIHAAISALKGIYPAEIVLGDDGYESHSI